MPKAVVFEDGKPVASSDKKEAERLTGRIAIIDKVLKEMGFSEGYARYNEYIQEMVSKDLKKYFEFIERVNELAAKQGV